MADVLERCRVFPSPHPARAVDVRSRTTSVGIAATIGHALAGPVRRVSHVLAIGAPTPRSRRRGSRLGEGVAIARPQSVDGRAGVIITGRRRHGGVTRTREVGRRGSLLTRHVRAVVGGGVLVGEDSDGVRPGVLTTERPNVGQGIEGRQVRGLLGDLVCGGSFSRQAILLLLLPHLGRLPQHLRAVAAALAAARRGEGAVVLVVAVATAVLGGVGGVVAVDAAVLGCDGGLRIGLCDARGRGRWEWWSVAVLLVRAAPAQKATEAPSPPAFRVHTARIVPRPAGLVVELGRAASRRCRVGYGRDGHGAMRLCVVEVCWRREPVGLRHGRHCLLEITRVVVQGYSPAWCMCVQQLLQGH